MIGAYDDLTPSALTEFGFDDPEHACRLLQGMSGEGVPDRVFDSLLPILLPALATSGDPDRALANFSRLVHASTARLTVFQLLTTHAPTVAMLATIFSASQFLSDLILQNPEYLEIVTNPTIRDRSRGPDALWADLVRRISICRTPNARRDALRRFKPPEILRIGVRDILGYADLPATIRDISDFADTVVRMAMEICAGERSAAPLPFAVIAMGKLGGRELNYASDIDLIFVHGDDAPAPEAIKLGGAVRDTLAKQTDAGFVFRVDLRLRPEGRFGAISRSIASCRAYYESWAEPWEQQALLKARFVAGDETVGAQFCEMAEAFVYRSRVEDAFVESIRANKRRLEQKVAGEHESDTNVKEGYGGIRDIEFTVQLMQLVAGGANPELRAGDTLTTLKGLEAAGLLKPDEANDLRSAYVFLRIVEHRLQLLDERPIRNIPRQAAELDKFGKRLGYANGERFLRDYRAKTSIAHALMERLFYAGREPAQTANRPESMDYWLAAPEDTQAQSRLREILSGYGFANPSTALQILVRSVVGSEYGGITPDARAAFANALPAILESASQTRDPDEALRGIDLLAQSVPSRATLYRMLHESPNLCSRLAQLAAEAPSLWLSLLQHLEGLDTIADDEIMDHPFRVPRELPATAGGLAGEARRARLHAAARDVWGLADVAESVASTVRAAERSVGGALGIARTEQAYAGSFAVIGMGKLGGAELGYGSDLDVIFIADADHLKEATRLAERVQQILREDMARSGFRYEIDARLRPDGQKGALVLDQDSYRRYFQIAAATWERQAFTRALPVAGDRQIAAELMYAIADFVYGSPLTSDEADEIRATKRRIERERWKDPHDLKLGPGGMADIEWTVQLLLLRHGHKHPRLRTTGTLTGLIKLRDQGLITQADWEALDSTYRQLLQLRNRLYLRFGVPKDAPREIPAELHEMMRAARDIVNRRFYGD